MDYPSRLEYSILQSENAEYIETKAHLRRIDLLRSGGYRLRSAIAEFLDRRAGEDLDLYAIRLKKFTYSNVLGAAIAQLSSKFSNGSVYVEGADSDFWEAFREDNNGLGRTEAQLIQKLFTELLSYRSIYVQVDKPASDVEPRSAAEELLLGHTPRLICHSAAQVTSWEEADGSLRWVKIFQIEEENTSPIEKPRTRATWTFVDDEKTARYSANVKLIDGQIVGVADADGIERGVTRGEIDIALVEGFPIAHGFGQIPIVRVELAPELWGGDQAAAKAEECLRLECHRYDYLTATYPQRTYKKAVKPDDTLGATFADMDEEALPTGLQYVLELDSFSWNEPAGQILDKVKDSLEQASKDIRSLLAVGGAYVQELADISGKSKEMDFVTEDSRLKSYGSIITDALQDIYQLVAVAVGDRVGAESITVAGLDEFGVDRLTDLIGVLQSLSLLDMNRLREVLSPTLYILMREKLLSFLMANLTPAVKAEIEAEIRAAAEPVQLMTETVRIAELKATDPLFQV